MMTIGDRIYLDLDPGDSCLSIPQRLKIIDELTEHDRLVLLYNITCDHGEVIEETLLNTHRANELNRRRAEEQAYAEEQVRQAVTSPPAQSLPE